MSVLTVDFGAPAPPVPEPKGVFDFELPSRLEAWAPPEERGAGRDDVRLLVARRSTGALEHRRFRELPDVLRPGDLLVVNTSATIPAALRGSVDGRAVLLHLSTDLGQGAGGDPESDGRWVVEGRHPEADWRTSSPWLDAPGRLTVELPAGGAALLLRPATAPFGPRAEVRLWEAELRVPVPVAEYLAEHGRPIHYGYVDRERPLSAYQTVFAEVPGSAEMPSAGRPFSAELVASLVSRGVGVTPIVLHTGVASPEAHEPPQAEWFRVPPETAARVNAARRLGGRVVAVGTTVVRALESAAEECGLVLPAEGWTDLVIDPARPVCSVDGMLTGWHEPRASHLAMLEAVAGRPLLEASYRSALSMGYLWHEFGDSHLILP
jgi:S-adenosylmethionine:tRNA ribosyltransferase-isomerase